MYIVLFLQDELSVTHKGKTNEVTVAKGDYLGYFPVFKDYSTALEAAQFQDEYVIPIEQQEFNYYKLRN